MANPKDKFYRKWHPNYDRQRMPWETSWEFYERAIRPMALDTNLRIRKAMSLMPFSKQAGLFRSLKADEPQVMGAIAECLVFGAVSNVADRIEVLPESTAPTPDFRAYLGSYPFDLEVTTFAPHQTDYEYQLHYEMDCVAVEMGLRNTAASVSVKPALRQEVPLRKIRNIVREVQFTPIERAGWNEPLSFDLSVGSRLKLRPFPAEGHKGLYAIGGATFTWQADIEAELTKALASKSKKKVPQVSGHNSSILVVWDRSELGGPMGLKGDAYPHQRIQKAVWPSPDSRSNLVEVWLVNTLWEHMTRKAQVHILTRGETPSQWSATELARGFHALTSKDEEKRFYAD